jgi:dihydrofolate reductase
VGRLIVSTQVTLDGVMDRIDKWFIPDGGHNDFGLSQLRAAGALLLGRKTYQGLASVWPGVAVTNEFAGPMNDLPKFVVSRTLRGPLAWNGILLRGDPADSVPRVKAGVDGDVLVYGCGGLAADLAALGLMDELRLFVHPVVLGEGERLFHSGVPQYLQTVGSRTFDSGVTLLTYRPSLDR